MLGHQMFTAPTAHTPACAACAQFVASDGGNFRLEGATGSPGSCPSSRQRSTCLRTFLSLSDLVHNVNIQVWQEHGNGSEQGAVSERSQRGGLRGALRQRGEVPRGGDRVSLAEWL